MAAITVAAVQMAFTPKANTGALQAHLLEAIQPAVNHGAQLVVLPQFVGSPSAGPDQRQSAMDDYCKIGMALAARCGIWLVPGSTIARESPDGPLYISACLFTPDGQIAGCQRQTHLGTHEKAWGVVRAEELNVCATPFGTAGLVLGEDVRYPEVSRILTLQGANILIHLGIAVAPFHHEAWLNELWREVQGNQVFGISSYLIGEYATQSHQGCSAVFAPVELTADDSGIITRARCTDDEDTVFAEVDVTTLNQVKEQYDIFRYFNAALYAREFPLKYQQWHAR